MKQFQNNDRPVFVLFKMYHMSWIIIKQDKSHFPVMKLKAFFISVCKNYKSK